MTEPRMHTLTDFQIRCESRLRDEVRAIGVQLINREVKGEHEAYVQIEIRGLTLWIYLDGVEIQGKGADLRLERYDFKSLEDLENEFVARVKSLLEGKRE